MFFEKLIVSDFEIVKVLGFQNSFRNSSFLIKISSCLGPKDSDWKE